MGGHRTFRPSILTQGLSDYGVVNVGAAGTFVVREPGSKTKFRAALMRKLPFEAKVDLRRSRSHPPRDGESVSGRAITARYRSICEHPVESRRPPRSPPVTFPPEGEWLVRVMASKEQFVFGVYRRRMKTIGYLGRIDTLFGVPATTRNWNTILAVVRILKGQEKKATN